MISILRLLDLNKAAKAVSLLLSEIRKCEIPIKPGQFAEMEDEQERLAAARQVLEKLSVK